MLSEGTLDLLPTSLQHWLTHCKGAAGAYDKGMVELANETSKFQVKVPLMTYRLVIGLAQDFSAYYIAHIESLVFNTYFR